MARRDFIPRKFLGRLARSLAQGGVPSGVDRGLFVGRFFRDICVAKPRKHAVQQPPGQTAIDRYLQGVKLSSVSSFSI
jgi:hypothetical protein